MPAGQLGDTKGPQGPLLVTISLSVAGLIDSLIYHSARAIQKKIDLGKTT